MLLFVIFLINCDFAVSQTKITTVHGNNIIGFMISETQQEIEIQTLNNIIVKVPKSDIDIAKKIELGLTTKSGVYLKGSITKLRETDFDFISTDSINATLSFGSLKVCTSIDKDINNFLKSKIDSYRAEGNSIKPPKFIEYKKIGLAVGTPGGIDIIYGSNNQKSCFGLSAGFTGFQIGGGISAVSEDNFELNFHINASYMKFKSQGIPIMTDYFWGFGPMVEFYIAGFHAQFGKWFWASGNVELPWFWQVGIVYRYGND